MKTMTATQKRSAAALIRAECCNCFDGECVALDCACPQISSYSLICKWFAEAVLPLDKALHAEIMGADGVKQCAVCGRQFRAVSSRAKYCSECAKEMRRKQQAKFAREKYAAKKGYFLDI